MNQDKFGITRQSAPAAGGAQERSNQCEVTASLARGQEATAEQVSPAVSPAISPSTVENYKTETDGDQSGSQSGTGNGKPDCYKCNTGAPLPIQRTRNACIRRWMVRDVSWLWYAFYVAEVSYHW